MPIRKDGSGTIIETPVANKDQFDRTGVIQDNQFALADENDKTKQIRFDASPLDPNASVTIKAGASSGDINITLPTSSGTLATTEQSSGMSFSTIQPPAGTSPAADSATDTLNLTASDSTIVITGTAATDTIDFKVGDTVVLTDTYQQVSNKDLAHDSVNITSVSNGYVRFDLQGGAFENRLVINNTAPRVLNVPDQDATLATLNDYDPSYTFYQFWDFIGYGQAGVGGDSESFYGFNSGAGSTYQTAGGFNFDTTHPGICRLQTGTTTTGFAGITQGTTMNFGVGSYDLEMLIYIPTLSDGTETYSIVAGFGNAFTSASDFGNGAYFRYTHGTNSGEWEGKTADNNSRTTLDTATAAAAGAWTKLRITVNAAANLATFYINGTSVGTIATNIPTLTARSFGPHIQITKSAGSTNRLLYVDYVKLKIVPTTPR